MEFYSQNQNPERYSQVKLAHEDIGDMRNLSLPCDNNSDIELIFCQTSEIKGSLHEQLGRVVPEPWWNSLSKIDLSQQLPQAEGCQILSQPMDHRSILQQILMLSVVRFPERFLRQVQLLNPATSKNLSVLGCLLGPVALASTRRATKFALHLHL